MKKLKLQTQIMIDDLEYVLQNSPDAEEIIEDLVSSIVDNLSELFVFYYTTMSDFNIKPSTKNLLDTENEKRADRYYWSQW